MNFSSMCNDVVTLVKQDGTVIEKIKANVQPNMIFIYDEKLPLEEDDKIYRPLPNGLVENYVVIDRGFYSAFHGIQAHYQAKVRKEGSIKNDQYQKITNIYNLNGPQSRVTINSTDNSTNILQQNVELFDDIQKALETISDEKTRIEAIRIAHEMKDNVGKPTFKEKYQSFISTLANYITIISPFIPALSALL